MSQIIAPTIAAQPFRPLVAEPYTLVDGGICEPKFMGAGWIFKWVEQGWPTRSSLLGGFQEGGDGRGSDGWTIGATWWDWVPELPGDQTRKHINGLTTDSNGNLVTGVTVSAVSVTTQQIEIQATSDANANYDLWVLTTGNYMIVGFLSGSPDTSGATDNNIAGV